MSLEGMVTKPGKPQRSKRSYPRFMLEGPPPCAIFSLIHYASLRNENVCVGYFHRLSLNSYCDLYTVKVKKRAKPNNTGLREFAENSSVYKRSNITIEKLQTSLMILSLSASRGYAAC